MASSLRRTLWVVVGFFTKLIHSLRPHWLVSGLQHLSSGQGVSMVQVLPSSETGDVVPRGTAVELGTPEVREGGIVPGIALYYNRGSG